MNLFVDANIFLDFYHFSDDDLEELEKLVDLITKGDTVLVTTTQIVDEVKRNRDSKVADAYNKFKESKIALNLPQICKGYSEFLEIEKCLVKVRSLKASLEAKLEKDINTRVLKADEIIDKLFNKAQLIDSEKYLDNARKRFDLGNPPGKNGSYGDALNWTALINELENKNDLFLISDDKDYKSPINEFALNSYLQDEWATKKKSKIFFYVKLSDFFNDHHKDIQLKVEEEKNDLITKLANSMSFATTHLLISKLDKYVSYTDEQVRELVAIALDNNQVGQILVDDDVRDFFIKLIKNKEQIIDPEAMKIVVFKMNSDENNE